MAERSEAGNFELFGEIFAKKQLSGVQIRYKMLVKDGRAKRGRKKSSFLAKFPTEQLFGAEIRHKMPEENGRAKRGRKW